MQLIARTAVLAAGLAAASWAGTITIFASDARNVSDYHEEDNGSGGFIIVTDGDGDQRATDAYPWLGAGINLSGASGQNGTARFQAEFSLAGIAGPITSAFLTLNSDFAPNQLIDTFFFHVTSAEEGNVTVNDFESPATNTGIVQPPVGADAEHSYDVTAFVVQDVMAGRAYTAFQGRVDETLATNLFRRGIEYYSNALGPGGNEDPALRPRLVVTYAEIPEPGTMVLFGAGLAVLLVARRRRSA